MLQFGTDGVRGDAETQLSTPFVIGLARAFVQATGARRVLVGRDPRESGPRIEAALAAGFAAEGAACELAGVVPTPGLAWLSRERDEWAAMVSASHNPWSDNGIKIFAPGGVKLSDEHQRAVEDRLADAVAAAEDLADDAAPDSATTTTTVDVAGYSEWLLAQVGAGALGGLRVVLDCANGATSAVAPGVFDAAGAELTVIHADPDGRNINEGCGSTHLESLQAAVVAAGADLGLAFDGDADRLLAVDADGAVVDGDQIMAILALALRDRGELDGDAIAFTVLSNLGLRQCLAARGIGWVETPVGDRHVVAAMVRDGLALGGEQSGHIVLGRRLRTGDGTLAGLLLAAEVAASGRTLADLAAIMTRIPQVLVNVRLTGPVDLAARPDVAAAVAAVEAELGTSGRVLVRPSGTEPVVRVMVEAPTADRAHAAADRIAAALADPAPAG